MSILASGPYWKIIKHYDHVTIPVFQEHCWNFQSHLQGKPPLDRSSPMLLRFKWLKIIPPYTFSAVTWVHLCWDVLITISGPSPCLGLLSAMFAFFNLADFERSPASLRQAPDIRTPGGWGPRWPRKPTLHLPCFLFNIMLVCLVFHRGTRGLRAGTCTNFLL